MSSTILTGLLRGDIGKLPFEPFRDGIQISHLYQSEGGRGSLALLRYEPGASVPLHEHPDLEIICVLSGSQRDDYGRYHAGDVVLNRPGSRHRVWSDQGCIVLVSWAAPVKFLSQGDAPAALVERCSSGRLPIAVVGAHLTGMPLNRELVELGGQLVAAARTAGEYRLFALVGTTPPKPGLIRAPSFLGPGIDIEIWSLDPASFGHFVAGIPQPLGIGKLTLADGSIVSGFLCEPAALEGAEDITHFGGWRAYVMAHKY